MYGKNKIEIYTYNNNRGRICEKKRDTRALYETAVSNPESIRLKTYVEKRHLTRWHQGQVCRAILR